jgi:hypothetical protein
MLSVWMEHHRYWQTQGERAEARAAEMERGGRRELPWIWKMNMPEDVDDSILEVIEGHTSEGELNEDLSRKLVTDVHSAIRLEWVRARASRDRFLEEIKLLRAESEKSCQSVPILCKPMEKQGRNVESEKKQAVGTRRNGEIMWRGRGICKETNCYV